MEHLRLCFVVFGVSVIVMVGNLIQMPSLIFWGRFHFLNIDILNRGGQDSTS